MCKFIGTESVAACALARAYLADQTDRIALDSLYKYGIEVTKFFDQAQIKAVVLLSYNRIQYLVRDYSDCFTLEGEYLCLVNKDIDYLIEKFICHWSIDIVSALCKASSMFQKSK